MFLCCYCTGLQVVSAPGYASYGDVLPIDEVRHDFPVGCNQRGPSDLGMIVRETPKLLLEWVRSKRDKD